MCIVLKVLNHGTGIAMHLFSHKLNIILSPSFITQLNLTLYPHPPSSLILPSFSGASSNKFPFLPHPPTKSLFTQILHHPTKSHFTQILHHPTKSRFTLILHNLISSHAIHQFQAVAPVDLSSFASQL
jgi:hypothetical protein